MVSANAANMKSINYIMKHRFTLLHFPLFSKYVNERFDIIVQNNQTIVVVDKILNRIYMDLKTACLNLRPSTL